MTVNGVTAYTSAAYDARVENSRAEKEKEKEKPVKSRENEQEAAVYEPSTENKEEAKKTTAPRTEADRQALIARLKAETDARTEKLRNIVQEMIAKQANAYGHTADIYQLLASGEFNVDEATKAEAEADIAEDGYYGVKQTSDRILDFAKALSGDDPTKAQELLEAFKKGYAQAEKTWGGELPDICKRTYDAVIEKFDAWAGETQS